VAAPPVGLVGCDVGAAPFRHRRVIPMARGTAVKPGSMWWLTAVMGVLLLVPGPVFVYQYLSEKEREGGTVRMHWIASFLYEMFGKWGVTLLMVVVGVGVLIAAALEFRKSRRTA
jgi:hypothetical protein